MHPPAALAVPLVAAAAAGLAVAVPVLVHLLSRRREQVVPWAAVRFLLAAQARRRRRVDRWLLLAARAAALLLLLAALCAATPWAERLWQAVAPGAGRLVSRAPRTHHVLVVDASLSTAARAGDASAWDRQLAAARAAVGAARAGDGFSLIVLAGGAQVPIPGPAPDAARVLAELERLSPSHAAGDAAAALAAAADILARSPAGYPRRQLLLFTDGQHSTWAAPLAAADSPGKADLWRPLTARADVAVVDLGADLPPNLAVTDLRLAEAVPLLDAPATVTAQVQNFGAAEVRDVRLELTVARPGGADRPPVAVEQRLLDAVAPGQSAGVTFALEGAARFRDAGPHLLQLRILNRDPLEADNARSLVADVRPALNAVLVSGANPPEPLRRSAGYLAEALDPGGRKLPGNPARARVLTPAEFADATLGDLSGADAVFLCDPAPPGPGPLARLEGLLRRGGGLVVGLGPNAAQHSARLNALLGESGADLLPAKLGEVLGAGGADEAGFRLAADDEAYRRPPLAAFRDPNARAGLTSVPFRKFARLTVPDDGRARVLARLTSAGGGAPEPAIVEWRKYRGRVVLVAPGFGAEWSDWPLLPSYLPFAHELLRYAAAGPDRHTVRLGEPLEEPVPAAAVGLEASLRTPDGGTVAVPVTADGDAGVARYADAQRAGTYRLRPPAGGADALFAVNVPAGAESDLRRAAPAEWAKLPGVQHVSDPSEVRVGDTGEAALATEPEPRGPELARWLTLLALVGWLAELSVAWATGPSRSSTASAPRPRAGWGASMLRLGLAALPLLAAGGLLAGLALLETDAGAARLAERLLGVPPAGPGEGVRWRVDGAPAFLASAAADAALRWGLLLTAFAFAALLYWRERRAAGGAAAVAAPLVLRGAALGVLALVVWPQLRVEAAREGWPDVAVILDTSGSMATADEPRDAAVRAKAGDLGGGDRLALAKQLTVRPESGWVARLLTERQVKVHVYSAAGRAARVAEVSGPDDLDVARAAVAALRPDGRESRLGDAVGSVAHLFRGRPLAAVVLASDGIVTDGDDLAAAGRAAGRAGVPLFTVALGDRSEPPDLILSDLKAEPSAMLGDELAFEARLTARGPGWAGSAPVTLSERVGGRLVERARADVRLDPTGAPVAVRLTHTPTEAGAKSYVVSVPTKPGEADAANNRLEHAAEVLAARKLKILLVEGPPRYEFRFLKALWERETESAGARSVELSTVLLDAGEGYAELDKSARRSLPPRPELLEFDAVVLGDFDPAHPRWPRLGAFLSDLGEFVRVKGGGLMLSAGERHLAAQLASPLGDLLPVALTDGAAPAGAAGPYRPRLTPLGRGHPLFRLAPDDAEAAGAWESLPPLQWGARGYRRKPSAEVLAVHPEWPAEGAPGENHPLALQQFVGAGRVVFLGFDETWRWRFRASEPRFDQFWGQAGRQLARGRVSRPELRPDKATPYRRGEPVRLSARFPDDAPAPADDADVRVRVERSGPGGPADAQLVRLAKRPGTRATFEGTLPRPAEGGYRLTLVPPQGVPGDAWADVRVLPPPAEGERLEPDRAALAAAASESRGKAYSLAEADDVVADIPEAPRVALDSPLPPVPVWNHAGLFGLVLALFAAEWAWRRGVRLT